MKRVFIFILILLCMGNALSAQQKPWTLSQCIEYARQNNLQVKMEEIGVEQASNSASQSKWDLAPSVNAGLSHNMSWGRSVNLQTLEIIKNKRSMSTSGNLSASATLFGGFSKNFGTDKALANPSSFWFSKNSAANMNTMYRLTPTVIRNMGKVQLALEYELTAVEYGDNSKGINLDKGLFDQGLHWVKNNRVQAMLKYNF